MRPWPQAARVPVIAYNVPARTAVDMLPATVARLAQLSAIVGIKEAVPQIARVRELLDACGPDFVVLSGDDATACEAMLCRGARGHLRDREHRAAGHGGNGSRGGKRRRAAPRSSMRRCGLHRDLFIEANPIPAKWVLARMGLIGPGIRLPLTELASTYHAAVAASAQAAGVVF
jgi:4-hydroxy-tetrahydrodipicolinate synthase